MQLASPQPKTPVANGQPRSVALYRILHLIIISLPRPVRRGMFGLVVSIVSIAMQCSAVQSRLVPSAIVTEGWWTATCSRMGPRRSAWADLHRSLTPRSRPRCIPRLCSPSQARLTFSLILRRASNTEVVTEQQGKRNTWRRAGKHQQKAVACLPLGLSGRIKLGRPC